MIERRHFRLHIRGDREPRSGEDDSGSAAGLSETGTSFRAKAGAFGGCDPMGMTSRRARRRPESQTDVHQQRHHGIARNQRTTHSRHPAFRPRDFAQPCSVPNQWALYGACGMLGESCARLDLSLVASSRFSCRSFASKNQNKENRWRDDFGLAGITGIQLRDPGQMGAYLRSTLFCRGFRHRRLVFDWAQPAFRETCFQFPARWNVLSERRVRVRIAG